MSHQNQEQIWFYCWRYIIDINHRRGPRMELHKKSFQNQIVCFQFLPKIFGQKGRTGSANLNDSETSWSAILYLWIFLQIQVHFYNMCLSSGKSSSQAHIVKTSSTFSVVMLFFKAAQFFSVLPLLSLSIV